MTVEEKLREKSFDGSHYANCCSCVSTNMDDELEIPSISVKDALSICTEELRLQRENIEKISNDIYCLTVIILQSDLYQKDSDVKELVDSLLKLADFSKYVIVPQPIFKE